jgi:hypothetical protein
MTEATLNTAYQRARVRPCPLAADRAAEAPAPVTAQFRPLDPDIVSATIPAFFIGRNKDGFWVARDADGRLGGVFLLESSALTFARRNSQPTGCATIYPSETVELDIENSGNPLVARLAAVKRFCMCALAALLAGGALAGVIALKTAAYFWRLH